MLLDRGERGESRLVSTAVREQIPFVSAATASHTSNGPENNRGSADTTCSGPDVCAPFDRRVENRLSASDQLWDQAQNIVHKIGIVSPPQTSLEDSSGRYCRVNLER